MTCERCSPRALVLGVAAILAGATVGCDGGSATEEPLPSLLEPGPHAVGYQRHTVSYQPRGVTGPRELGVDVWYPAVAGTGAPTTFKVAGLVEVERAHVFTDAALVDGDTLPVLAYSHGNRGVGIVAFDYGEHFASRGWVVVAPDHTGNTVLDGTNSFGLSNLLRPQDLSAVLDWLEDGAPAPLAGRTDGRVLAVGHSFGAYTVMSMAGALSDWTDAAASCAAAAPGDGGPSCAIYGDPAARAVLDAGFADPRVDAVVPQAGRSDYAAGALAGVALPTLWMSGRGDVTISWDAHGEPGWQALDGPDDVWVDLVRGGHYSFLGLCSVVDLAILDGLLGARADGCGPDFTPIDEIMPAVVAYTHAFGRQHVLGEARWSTLFAGPSLHPDVVVTLR